MVVVERDPTDGRRVILHFNRSVEDSEVQAIRVALAMEAAKPSRREAGSARKGNSAGPKDNAQEPSHD